MGYPGEVIFWDVADTEYVKSQGPEKQSFVVNAK